MSPAATALDSAPPTVRELTDDYSDLQKEVFSWRMLEDAFGGIIDPLERDRLTQVLSQTMAPDVHPRDRSIASLRAFVDDANRILAARGGVDWSDSQNPLSDDDERLRLNALLALVNHLSWLIAIFKDQPNVSVSIR